MPGVNIKPHNLNREPQTVNPKPTDTPDFCRQGRVERVSKDLGLRETTLNYKV